MSKKKIDGDVFDGKEPVKEVVKSGSQKTRSVFVNQLAALMYYGSTPKEQEIVPYEKISDAESDRWYVLAGLALIGIDKMGKCVQTKVESAQSEQDYNQSVQNMSAVISNFVRNVQTIRCPKCGSKADVRAAVFPCEELAHRIVQEGNGNG